MLPFMSKGKKRIMHVCKNMGGRKAGIARGEKSTCKTGCDGKKFNLQGKEKLGTKMKTTLII